MSKNESRTKSESCGEDKPKKESFLEAMETSQGKSGDLVVKITALLTNIENKLYFDMHDDAESCNQSGASGELNTMDVIVKQKQFQQYLYDINERLITINNAF